MSDYTLLTGPTGLLGRYLLHDLLRAGHRVAVVVRPSDKQTAAERIESILQFWESDGSTLLPRPVCFEGDITEEFLGLDHEARQWVAKHCSSVLHNAAALKFHEEANGEPWRTNVEGTRHVLQLCHDTGIKRIHYVSTAYVCGTRSDTIMEDTLDSGQLFRNDYEKSKLEAETMVRGDSHFDQVTIYRPAVIAGDSQTGYTNTYHGLFMYLKLMAVLVRNTEPDSDGVRHTPLELTVTGDEPRNVIPVDWTSAVITHLFSTPQSHGRTFHLAPSTRMTARQMIEAGYSYFNSAGVEFVGPAKECPEYGMDRDTYENSMMYRDYEGSDPEFDTTNLRHFAAHLPCPTIDEPMLHRFMKFGEEDRWGKRREKPAKVPFVVEDFLSSLIGTAPELNELTPTNGEKHVGLDVCGPGGGQWTVTFAGERVVAYQPGISSGCGRVLTFDSPNLSELAAGNATSLESQYSRQIQSSACSVQR